MKKSIVNLGLASLALTIAAPAQAGTSADFAGCDGLKKPKRSDDGMRGEATMPSWGFGSSRPDPRKTIAACQRALDSGKLRPEQTLRRAHVMRALAAAKLEIGDHEGALADLDAAEVAGKDYDGDFFYERSMGVSLDLLRAIVLNDLGKREEAQALAEAALQVRPYSLVVQRVGTVLRSTPGDENADPAMWNHLGKIDPATRDVSSRMGRSPDSFAMLASSAGEPRIDLPGPPTVQQLMNSNGSMTPFLNDWIRPIGVAMRTAYALAAAGKPEAANAWTQTVEAALDGEIGEEDEKGNALAKLLASTAKSSAFEPYAELVSARIAISEGRLPDAAAVLQGKSFLKSPITDDLWRAYETAAEGQDAPALPPLGAAVERKTPRLAGMAGELLMRPESERKLIAYKASRPNILGALVGGAFSLGTSLLGGIPRTSGFEETENEDGSIKVEYTGNTTSGAVVQEMTLLRAAEIAQAAEKSHFHIEDRRDYQRYMTMSQYGVERSRTLAGYKTVLTVTLLDNADNRPQAIDAVAIIDALGPIYYGD